MFFVLNFGSHIVLYHQLQCYCSHVWECTYGYTCLSYTVSELMCDWASCFGQFIPYAISAYSVERCCWCCWNHFQCYHLCSVLVKWLMLVTSYLPHIWTLILHTFTSKYFVYIAYMQVSDVVGIFIHGTYMAITYHINVAFCYILAHTCNDVGLICLCRIRTLWSIL